MSKYIDADRLRAEIDKRMTENCKLAEKCELVRTFEAFGNRASEDNDILSIIESLRQEQPKVDLERIIEQTYHDGSVADTDDMDHATYENIAHHFYELGQRKAAEMYDEIEYNRQRAEEEMPDKTLDEAANKYADGENPTCLCGECLIKTFIAGAKWMAGQGVTCEGKVFTSAFTSYVKTPRIEELLKDVFPEDTEVIVQIRKKEESK